MTCAKGCGRAATRRGLCHSHYETMRSRQKAYGRWDSLYVDAEPARQHVLALKAAGMGDRRIAELAGVARNNVRDLLTGRRDRSPAQTLLRRNADKIMSVTADPAPGAHVDACGTIRRLRALVAIGHTQTALCSRLGVTPGNGCQLFRGERTWVTAATATKVADLYNQLAMTPGPSGRARRHAHTRGWAPPLAWDDDLIDNPNAQPDLGEKRSMKFDERFLELRDLGYTDLQIAAKLKVLPESLLRQLDRYSIRPDPELVTEASSRKWKRRTA